MGERRLIAWSNTSLKDAGGHVTHIIGTGIDVTARRQAENEVRQAKEYLENILENSADPIGIVDQHGRIIKWNKASEQVFGYSFDELEGKSSFELYADKNATAKNVGPIAPGRLGPRIRDPYEEKGWEHCACSPCPSISYMTATIR